MKKLYPAKLESLNTIADDVENFCAECGASQSEIYAINLCLDEVFTNIVTYGYENDPTKDVEIELEKISLGGKPAVRVCVRDEAKAFDPIAQAAAPELDSPLESRCVGGLGVFFLKKNMDEIFYARKDGRINELCMIKYISGKI